MTADFGSAHKQTKHFWKSVNVTETAGGRAERWPAGNGFEGR